MLAIALLPLIGAGAAGLSALGSALGRGKDRELSRELSLADIEFQREGRKRRDPFLNRARQILLSGPRPVRPNLSSTFASQNPFARSVPATLPDSLAASTPPPQDTDGIRDKLDEIIEAVMERKRRRGGKGFDDDGGEFGGREAFQ